MAQNITLLGASYQDVPGVDLPKTGGGTARFTDISDTTATASDVAQGKYFYAADGTRTAGTSSGGGTSPMQVGTATKALTAAASSISFTGLGGEPTSFAIVSNGDIATGGSKAAAVVFDGTSTHAQTITSQVEYASSGFSHSYSGGTLTVTSTGAQFQAVEYALTYTYGGTAGNVGTADVQVGSGATSITFAGLEDEPECWAAIFKSSFSTSSGYQRVIAVVSDGTSVYGMEMDSGAKAASHWSASYSNGSLTIASNGTNQGGYWHQPGYYELVYAVGGDQSLQTKTVTPSTSTQNVTADTAQGYTALKKVVVNPIPSQYIVPTGNIAITSNSNSVDVAQYATASVNVPTGGSSWAVDTKTTTASNRPTSLSFTSMKGEPHAFFLRCTSSMSRSSNSSYYYVADMRYNGTNTTGNCWRMSNGNWTNVTSGYSFTYSGTTLTVTSSGTTTSSPGCFYSGNYELVYIY